MRFLMLLGLALSVACIESSGQDTPSLSQVSVKRYVTAVGDKSEELSNKIDRRTLKYLNKLQKQEQKLYKKLSKVDSVKANLLLARSHQQYEEIRNQLKNKSVRLLRGAGDYLPRLDTSLTSLKFLEGSQLTQKLPVSPEEIKNALARVDELKDKFRQAANVKEFIRNRKELLAIQLKGFNLTKDLQKFNKEAYYYSQQINEYKEILNDPSKLESKAISLLRKIPAFEKFMQENGQLAGLFNIPRDYATSMTGLQTINQVQSLLQDRMSMAGPNPNQTVQQNIGVAQAALTSLRNRISQGGSNESEIPEFKPNTQRTKTFLQRLEFGTNIQSTKSTTMFPRTTDIGLSIGYKLNDKSVIGMGGSYKLGLGQDWKSIDVSHQGVGLRSFVDYRLKGSFWISGGAEMNYRSQFDDLSIFNTYSPWQKSALLGLNKKYSIGKRFKGNIQLLYDFLHAQQIPKAQPIIFRAGYTF